MKLPISFYQSDDVLNLSRQLLGKTFYSMAGGFLTSGIIIETEAYAGPEDRGSHAFNGRRTPRTEIMYGAGGVLYMYICYGIHDMVNIVTGSEGNSHAILIRALQPVDGIETMRERRKIFTNDVRLCQGPGALAQALGLTKTHNGLPLDSNLVWIEEPQAASESLEIATSPRIGMNFDGPYQSIHWRFYLKGNKYVSARRS